MTESVCPLEFRYGRKEMRSIFDEGKKLEKMLKVEASLARAHSALGNISKSDADAISKAVGKVRLTRVKEVEEETRHDVMAVVKAMSEVCGGAGKYVHLGATSNDITDTATALQLKEAIELICADLEELRAELVKLAVKHKKTIMLGRTHAQAALPITFGLKMAVFALETHRHLERLKQAKRRITVGKMSGAVGTGASFGTKAFDIQAFVMKDLGLDAEDASGQIVGRDRYAEFVLMIANMASSMDKFATEIRNLQRSEVGEVQEAFDVEKQVGSSTMAHKRNPITSENVCGLARIIRGFTVPALENIPLWHERDLTNSSSERFILPHVCILADDIIIKMTAVFKDLKVNERRMKENLGDFSEIMSEAVMLALSRKGIGRQEAHEIIRKAAIESTQKNRDFREVMSRNGAIRKYLTKKELEDALNPSNYLGSSEKIVENAVRICKG